MTLRILRGLAVAVLAIAFLWGLFVFGSTRTPDLERLFVLVCIPTTGAVLGLFGRRPFQAASAPLVLAVGGLLCAMAGFGGAVQGRGYVVLALGWSAYFLTLAIAGRSLWACRWFLFALIAIGILEAFYGLAQAVAGMDYIGGYHRGIGRVATGTLFNRNHFAGLINLIIPLGFGALLARQASRTGRSRGSEDLAAGWIIVLISSLLGLAVLLSQSRGGTLSLIFCLLLTAFLLRAKRRAQTRWAAFAPWLYLLLVAGLGLGVGVQGLFTKFESAESSLKGRTAIYLDTLELIADHPLAGVGPGMYAWRFRPYQSVSGQVWFDYAHNDYLQTAAEWGVPLALLFWAWVCWRLFRSVKLFFRSRDGWLQGIALGCAVSLFSILLHSMVDFNLYIPTTLMVFCSVLGLSAAAEQLDARPVDPVNAKGGST